jgi:hypothetical protein
MFSLSFLPDVQLPCPPRSSMRTTDPATVALARLIDSTHCLAWCTKSEVFRVPASTLWHRANGRSSREEKSANQQYLTTSKEDALANDILRMAKNGYPLPAKFLPLLAVVLRKRRLPSNDSKPAAPLSYRAQVGSVDFSNGTQRSRPGDLDHRLETARLQYR